MYWGSHPKYAIVCCVPSGIIGRDGGSDTVFFCQSFYTTSNNGNSRNNFQRRKQCSDEDFQMIASLKWRFTHLGTTTIPKEIERRKL